MFRAHLQLSRANDCFDLLNATVYGKKRLYQMTVSQTAWLSQHSNQICLHYGIRDLYPHITIYEFLVFVMFQTDVGTCHENHR